MRSTGNYWFIWNGEKSTDYGIYVSTPPDIVKPAERVEFIKVPGRNGSLTVTEGDDVYEDIIQPIECVMRDMDHIEEIGEFLSGAGTLELAERPDGYFKGRIVNQIDFRRIVRGRPNREFTVNFRLSPFWYTRNGATRELTAPGNVFNPGNVKSQPTITVWGSGDINLYVGSQVVSLRDVSDYIVLNGILQEAYGSSSSMNNYMTGEFPMLMPGNNEIHWSGNVNKVLLEAEFCYRI